MLLSVIMKPWLYTAEAIPDGYGMGSFSIGHLAWLAAAALICIVLGRKYRISGEGDRKRIRWILAILLLADEGLKYAVTIPTGQWEWEFLPLHLCSISVFIAFFHAVSGSLYLAEYLYAVSLPTALMALVFPDWMNLPLINIMCFHSFSIHILIALYPAMLLFGGFRPSAARLIRIVPFIAVYGVAIYFINKALGTNFFFMNGPAEGNPLTILERYIGGWYRIAFPIIAAIVWLPMYLPFRRSSHS